jgi:hypothetical protein
VMCCVWMAKWSRAMRFKRRGKAEEFGVWHLALCSLLERLGIRLR